MSKPTPGPWRWELNEKFKSLHLVGGKPQFDLTIIQPTRWGMNRATLMIRDTAFDGLNLMHKLHERRDWIEPFPGRAHHADWCAAVKHPDMQLIEAAPDLLGVAHLVIETYPLMSGSGNSALLISAARAAIAKATGAPTQTAPKADKAER